LDDATLNSVARTHEVVQMVEYFVIDTLEVEYGMIDIQIENMETTNYQNSFA